MFKGVSKVIKAYIYWDFLINSAWGLFGPLFAIFILQDIVVNDLVKGAEIVGLATFFYWIVKSILQIPIARYLDRKRGETDDFWFYVIGTILTGLVPFGFLFSSLPWHIYLLQVLHAIGMSMIIPASYAIFIRHADKGKEAYESGLDSTLLGIGAGITGAIGGVLVGYVGFNSIFILTGFLTLFSVLLILPMKKHMITRSEHETHDVAPFQGHIDY